MVQKYQSSVRVYKYPFELVMAAYELRFPTCEMIPIFVGSDVISEETSEDGAMQTIERRCKLNVEAPYLLKKMSGVDYFYFIQRNCLDRRQRQLKIEAWNESFANRIIINEYCTYSVHPENADWTCFEQSASLEVKSFFGFENAVEKLAVKHYAANVKKGKEIIEHYVGVLKDQNITHVLPFKDNSQDVRHGELASNGAGESKEKKLTADGDEISSTSSCSTSVDGSNDMIKRGGSCSSIISAETTNSFSRNNHHSHSMKTPGSVGSSNLDFSERLTEVSSPLDEDTLAQLKKWLIDTQDGNVPSDQILMKFLQSQNQLGPDEISSDESRDDVSYRISLLRLINETTKRC